METLQKVKTCIEHNFPSFGINKKNELVRLFYEISKREDCTFDKILDDLPCTLDRFSNIKDYLIARRFPSIPKKERKGRFVFSEIRQDPKNKVKLKKTLPQTYRNFYIEKSVLGSDLVKRIKRKFKKAKFHTITTYKNHVSKKPYHLYDYNKRAESIFIVKENFDFFQACPCSPRSNRCGYHNMKLGWGCPFECIYCFLPAYLNSPGIVIPANIEDFFKNFKKHPKSLRVGTGQFTDSLVFDPITEYSPQIIDFFRNYPKTIFEFKTKSDNVDLIIKQKPSKNIVIAWSLNPEKIIKETEHYTATLKRRLIAATKCAKAGFRVAFHFDPIIYYKGCEKDYTSVVYRIFDSINDKSVAWISLGTLRMTLKQKKVIEKRFPKNTILDAELIPGYDEKLRYHPSLRKVIYKTMKTAIKKRSKSVPIYLCMESSSLSKSCQIRDKL